MSIDRLQSLDETDLFTWQAVYRLDYWFEHVEYSEAGIKQLSQAEFHILADRTIQVNLIINFALGPLFPSQSSVVQEVYLHHALLPDVKWPSDVKRQVDHFFHCLAKQGVSNSINKSVYSICQALYARLPEVSG